jgi:HK97 family phage major capsid protein
LIGNESIATYVPFWVPDPSADGPFDKLLGYNVVLNQAMPNLSAANKAILFGDLESAYMLRTDGQPSILRLNERFIDVLEVGFLAFSRIGGTGLIKSGAPQALAALQQHA